MKPLRRVPKVKASDATAHGLIYRVRVERRAVQAYQRQCDNAALAGRRCNRHRPKGHLAGASVADAVLVSLGCEGAAGPAGGARGSAARTGIRPGDRDGLAAAAAVHDSLGCPVPRPCARPGVPERPCDWTVFWAAACAVLATRRFARIALLWFALGLLVGWSRAFLGIHFPLDVLGAMPVAVLAALSVRSLRRPMRPMYTWAVNLWARIERRPLAFLKE